MIKKSATAKKTRTAPGRGRTERRVGGKETREGEGGDSSRVRRGRASAAVVSSSARRGRVARGAGHGVHVAGVVTRVARAPGPSPLRAHALPTTTGRGPDPLPRPRNLGSGGRNQGRPLSPGQSDIQESPRETDGMTTGSGARQTAGAESRLEPALGQSEAQEVPKIRLSAFLPATLAPRRTKNTCGDSPVVCVKELASRGKGCGTRNAQSDSRERNSSNRLRRFPPARRFSLAGFLHLAPVR